MLHYFSVVNEDSIQSSDMEDEEAGAIQTIPSTTPDLDSVPQPTPPAGVQHNQFSTGNLIVNYFFTAWLYSASWCEVKCLRWHAWQLSVTDGLAPNILHNVE